MITAALIVLLCAITVLIGGLVLITVVFSRSLQRVADHADRVHERSVNQLSSVLDRLMARDFGEFKVYQAGEEERGEVISGGVVERPWAVPPFSGGDGE